MASDPFTLIICLDKQVQDLSFVITKIFMEIIYLTYMYISYMYSTWP